ncbi:MAG: MFS transporter [Alphaproteobacteria bacterium]|nr:MFS transporter [Alphaproteobacteria bacterium]MBU0798475.1 MFS transporter [Alphaproteobacteria bacterium]MBU0886720.1 MFS transporter [Alphaproteobacteria bacterium]MBU1812552.1 MFS transporter [Alphaproteobacteria bacterium]MBU2091997.1 MFS transporter [Alphaproteobacteria bacterium]
MAATADPSSPSPVPPTDTDKGLSRQSWIMVLTLATAQLISWGSLFYAFSLFVVPMEEALGWSRATINGALSIGLLVSGLTALPVGMAIDRGHARLVMTVGSLLGGGVLLVWAVTESVIAFYAIWAVMGVALASTLYEPAFAVLAVRLGRKYRTGITAMTLIGGLASTAFLPLTQLMIELWDWRTALLGLAAFNLIICAGIHLVVLAGSYGKVAPLGQEEAGSVKSATPKIGGGALLGQLTRQPKFWALVIAFVCYSGYLAAMLFHLVPLMIDRGVSMGVIIGAMSVIGPMQVVGRIVLISLGPRLSSAAAGRIVFTLMVGAVFLLWALPTTPAVIFSFAALYGTANGIMTIVRATIVPELLTKEAYATVNGAMYMPATLTKAAGPILAALLWEWSGGYDAVLLALVGLAAVAALAFWLAGTPKPEVAA